MNPIDFAVRRPVTILVALILVILFGTLAITMLPIQLTPDVDTPRITVTTLWEGASPAEVEREIVVEQEDLLKAVPNLKKLNSTAVRGTATVEMEFRVGADIPRALLEVSDRLRQVPSYPEGVEQPVVTAGEIEGSNAIAWFILRKLPGALVDDAKLPMLRTLVEEDVKPIMDRAPGVAGIGVVGGVEREIHIQVEMERLAGLGLSLLDLRRAIQARNVDVSAGDRESGKASWTVRTVGRFETLREIEDLIVLRTDDATVRLADVAQVKEGFKEADTVVRALGFPSIAVNATRESGTNVIIVMEELKEATAIANRTVLNPRGLELIQVYDQTLYIYSAIDLVLQNLWVGGALAILVLLLFLKNFSSTLITAVAIPVSIVGSFLALVLLGRNLNVVSLAGLAFAVGMVVDNSIVVLENIYRHRQEGKGLKEAAIKGAKEVWGAVLASTLTTMAVFIPVIFVKEEAGQLFADIAIAIAAAVFISMLVAVFLIPMASSRLLKNVKPSDENRRSWGILGLDVVGRAFSRAVVGLVRVLTANTVTRLLTLSCLTGAAIWAAIVLLPPMSYLPQGNQNLVLGFLITPPGYNNSELDRIAEEVESHLSPYWAVRDGGELSPELRRPDWYQGEAPLPGITNFFYVATGTGVFMGARSDDPMNVKPLEALMIHSAQGLPGVFVFAMQRSLFERGLSTGTSIDLEVTGPHLEELTAAAGALFGATIPLMGTPRPEPSNFDVGAPELRIKLDHERAGGLGLNVQDVGFLVRSMVDGAVVSEMRSEGITFDIKLMPSGEAGQGNLDLAKIPIVAPTGQQVMLGSIASFESTTSPTQIRHIEESRAIRLIVTPPPGIELEVAMDQVQTQIIDPLRDSGAIPLSVTTRLAGTADKLLVTREALKWNLILAAIITYLLLASLFESFLYPFMILFSVPLAAVGGIMGLRLMHTFTGQEMDVLTMLGFVILIGTVVNNAILLVHQALIGMREKGRSAVDAMMASVRTRIRPIFMSTMTSVLGMAPLVFFPGAGSELYRGLGSVVLGGILVSSIFTLLVIPSLFLLFHGGRSGRTTRAT